VVLVLNNRDLNQVTWEQRAMAGDPKFAASQEVPDFGYAAFAESIGLMGRRVDDPDDVGDAWDQVLGADRPAVLEAVTDPNVPPLPPHISLAQAKAFATSVLKGDAEALGFIKQTVKDAVESYLPRKS
jgi:pyruvate dehydrogenase (quinone)